MPLGQNHDILEPLISVVIPTCNRNDLLAQCVDQLAPAKQTLLPDRYEVIVTDDGNSDTTEQMLRERYPWVRYTKGPRRGPAANRNNGAKCARGQWIAFTDDDCVPRAAWLKAYSDAIIAGIEVYEGRTTCVAGLHSPLDYAPINLTGGWLWSCNMMIGQRIFRELGGFSEAYEFAHMEDLDLRERIKDAKYQFQFVQAAEVDHPPRRMSLFRKIAPVHECEVIYSLRRGRKPNVLHMVCETSKARLRTVFRFPLSLDSAVFLCSAMLELGLMVTQFNRWKVRGERLVQEAHSAAPPRSASTPA